MNRSDFRLSATASFVAAAIPAAGLHASPPARRALRCAAALLVVAATALGGCGKETPPAEASTKANAAAAAPAAPDPATLAANAHAKAEAAALPRADAATPAAQYREIDSGNQLMFAYLALSGMPPDYPAIAQRLSREYAGTGDAFRKQELLNALKPQIDAKVKAAAGERYFKYRLNGSGMLQAYDLDKGAFPSKLGEAGTYYYLFDNGEYQLAFTNGEAFAQLKVPAEAARAIEAARSSYRNFDVVVYGFAQDADITSKRVRAQIVRVGIRVNGTETLVEAAG